MTRTDRQSLGDAGERLAQRRLEAQGYRPLARNWRCPSGELDLIMRDDDVLVFVEVRVRHDSRLGTAEETISPAKARSLLRAAQQFVATRTDVADAIWRIDLVAITLDAAGRVARFNHLVNAIESR